MAETTSPVRSDRKRKLRTWGYIGGLLSLFAFLALAPDLVRKTKITYTASELPTAQFERFDMNTAFPRVTAQGASETVSLAALAAGRPGGLLVNFWATWCPPCLEELPSLETLHRQLESKNDPKLPRLVTLSVDEAPADVLRLLWQRRPQVVMSTLGHLNLALAMLRPLLPGGTRYLARETTVVSHGVGEYRRPQLWGQTSRTRSTWTSSPPPSSQAHLPLPCYSSPHCRPLL